MEGVLLGLKVCNSPCATGEVPNKLLEGASTSGVSAASCMVVLTRSSNDRSSNDVPTIASRVSDTLEGKLDGWTTCGEPEDGGWADIRDSFKMFFEEEK